MSDSQKKIEELVLATATAALTDKTSLDQKLDALKILEPYYSVMAKVKASGKDAPGDGANMNDLREHFNGADEPERRNGPAPLRSRTG